MKAKSFFGFEFSFTNNTCMLYIYSGYVNKQKLEEQ